MKVELDTGRVRFIVDSGTRVRIGEIQLMGNIFTHDYVIRRELDFVSGDSWAAEEIRKNAQALLGTGNFSLRIYSTE